MSENVPNWVRRWGQLKLAAGLSMAAVVVLLLLAFTLAIPFIVPEVMGIIYEWIGREPTIDYWTMVAISALLEVAALGYVVIDTLAWRYRNGMTENGGIEE